MSNYSQNVFFGPKDALSSGDPNKVIKGTELDAELQEISDAIATKVETGSVPSGTKMIMVETSAPSGWTLNTAYDGRTIIISDGPTDDGTPDTNSDTWTITGLTHSHTHGVGTLVMGNGNGTELEAVAGGGIFTITNTHSHTIVGSTGSASTSAVSSNGTWRPPYVEVIVCEKD